jgi:hypothetical protein
MYTISTNYNAHHLDERKIHFSATIIILLRFWASIISKNQPSIARRIPQNLRNCNSLIRGRGGADYASGVCPTRVWSVSCSFPSSAYSDLIHKDPMVASENAVIFQSIQRCLQLRDKYMFKSCQRLGDNPRDHDGVFTGINEAIADVSGVRPDYLHAPPVTSPFQPWKIYPPPPPPRWKFSDEHEAVGVDGTVERANDGFDPQSSEMPGEHPLVFKIDETGVFQVYETLKGMLHSLNLFRFDRLGLF